LGFLAEAQQRPDLRDSFDIRLGHPPQRAHYNGEPCLVYEVHLTNLSGRELLLQRLQLLETGTSRVHADFSDDVLSGLIGRADRPAKGSSPRSIPAGVHATIYLTIPLQSFGSAFPALLHRVTYADPAARQIEGAGFTLPAAAPVVLGPLFRSEGLWVPVYNDTWERGHRRVLYTTAGVLRIPGRFAIDWMQIREDGTHSSGDESQVRNWHGYAAEVLAVADGIVVAVHDDIGEPAAINDSRKVDLQNASGNYVVLELAKGRYAFYEHLKPASILVRPGARVRRGQVIGALGFTGQSTGPHLHFHLASANSTLDAEGLPYVFEEFEVLGGLASPDAFLPDAFLKGGWQRNGVPELRRNEVPKAWAVIRFSAKPASRTAR
jgi:murein DD-endopeptidase